MRRRDGWFYRVRLSPTVFNGATVPERLGWNEAVGGYTTPIRGKPIRLAAVTD